MKPTDEIVQERDDRWWRACLERDASFEGQFVVAVRTTGIYCRPTCPARPKRQNVEFFLNPGEAELHGYRACKRCEPNKSFTSTETIVARACEFIEEHGHARLREMGAALCVSPFHLQRVFKAALGVSPARYVRAKRLQTIKAELKSGARVTDAALNAGFSGSNRVGEQAGALGMPPVSYRKGGMGVVISYAVVETDFGLLLTAGTERGLCAVFLGDTEVDLARDLRDEYPAAEIRNVNDERVRGWAGIVRDYLRGHQSQATLLKLPLDVQGTAFQANVWEALKSIPSGERRCYAEVAEMIGDPNATRAVAGACASNRLALVIPCHRVVRSDGSLSGYRWGPERKRRLLDWEREHAL